MDRSSRWNWLAGAPRRFLIGCCCVGAGSGTPAQPSDAPPEAVSATAAAGAPAAALQRLAWLTGCWRSDSADAGSGEQWTALAGGTLLGVGRTVRGGATVAHEFMQIRQQPQGAVVFIAQPAGQPETEFVLLPGAAFEAVFENAAHDYPQRVIYRLAAGGRLRTRIEGQRAGVLRAQDWTLVRAACDAQPALPEAFQGLPWGANEAQMALRFGAPLRRADCAVAARRAPALRPREACDHPVVQPYDLVGLPFRLGLHVDDRTRQLVRVSLTYAGGLGMAAEKAAEKAAVAAEAAEAIGAAPGEAGWGEKHRLLRQLLTQRYGGPESTHVASDPDALTATARWRRGDTMIELNSIFQPRSAAGAAREQVEIIYQPTNAGDAGKL